MISFLKSCHGHGISSQHQNPGKDSKRKGRRRKKEEKEDGNEDKDEYKGDENVKFKSQDDFSSVFK